MKIKFKDKSGFTLIELMVTISIIGLLSSVVFATLSNARNKAKDVAIKQEVNELATLADLEFNDTQSYCGVQTPGGWVNSVLTCSAIFSSLNLNYKDQAKLICKNIISNARDVGWSTSTPPNPDANKILVSTKFNDDNQPCPGGALNVYAFSVPLNNGNWYCAGSSGKRIESSSWGTCWNNP